MEGGGEKSLAGSVISFRGGGGCSCCQWQSPMFLAVSNIILFLLQFLLLSIHFIGPIKCFSNFLQNVPVKRIIYFRTKRIEHVFMSLNM